MELEMELGGCLSEKIAKTLRKSAKKNMAERVSKRVFSKANEINGFAII
jgi:hypothetical protein